MDKKLVLLPLALLAGTSLSGCVAVAIPALAGSAMVGSRVMDKDDAAEPEAAAVAAPAPAPAPVIKPVPVPSVTVATGTTIVPPPAAPRAAPGSGPPAPARAAAATTTITIPPPVAAPVKAPAPPVVAPPVVAAPVSVAAAPIAVPPTTANYPDPSRPLEAGQTTFARFVRYIDASARGAKEGADLNSAMLSDPIALDGKRRRCAVGEQLVALIDLDPTGGVFAPPASPDKQPGLALGLAMLRDAGVEIAWMSDLPVSQSGALRTALEGAGLDPRGQDIISLRRDETDTKQQRRDSLAGITCIIAIAGDERPDFDERFKYLRNPAAGAGIEPLIGDGWFLIEPLLAK